MQQNPQQQWPGGPTRSQIRRARRFLVAALILAWATQLLVTQWAAGAQQQESDPAQQAQPAVVVHMRASANITGTTVTLADIAQLQWLSAEPALEDGRPVSHAALAEAPAGETSFVVGIEQVLRVLGEAKVHPGRINIQGPLRCQVNVTVPGQLAQQDEETALLEWAGETAEPAAAAPRSAPARTTQSNAGFAATRGTLADVLRQDLAQRLGLPAQDLFLNFRAQDARLVSRTDLGAQHVTPARTADLGPVAWSVSVNGQSHTVHAEAYATVTRAVLARPVSRGQVIRAEDIIAEPARISRMADRGVAPAEAVGQEASRALSVGDVLTPDRLGPRMLVRRGQLITVQLVRGGIVIRTLAKAMEEGAYGQVVKARSESNGEILHVTMIAPQSGMIAEPAGH